MATVHLAEDLELARPVALKVLAAHLAGDEAFRVRFVREARLAARLSHPNVVQVYDAGEDDGRPYIVMEYVPGATAAAELERAGRFPSADAVDLALQVCAGLDHAHAAGLVHRDVKPQNLLVREDRVVKIADFGIARAAEATQLTQIGGLLGTAAYLSPEQAAGERVTAAADLYALGVVLYELLTGRTPHTFESLADLVGKHREEPVTPVRELAPDVPEGLEAVVMRCLARNPDYRPASAAALASELAGASPEGPTVPLPAGPGTRATLVAVEGGGGGGRAPRRGRAVTAAVVAFVALVALAAGAWVLAARDGSAPGPEEVEPAGGAARVEPVPAADDPAAQARNLSDWLRERGG